MIFWIIVGIAIGYFFKPQLDRIIGKVMHSIKDNRKHKWDDDDF